MIKKRRERNKEILNIRDKKVMEEYAMMDSEGNNIYTVDEVANRNNISVPMIYKIRNRINNKKDKY